MERRRLASWGTIGAGGAIVLASLTGPVSAMPPTPAPTPAVMEPMPLVDACGDADGDRVLSVTDGVRILRAAAGLDDDCTPYRCDVDGSGAVTVTDGVGTLSRAAGLRFDKFYECPVPARTRDFSEFAHFSLSRVPGLGYCPSLGSVVTVDIVREGAGSYRLRSAVAVERSGGDPACVVPYAPPDAPWCIAADARPERLLTAAEVDRVRAAFAAVEVYEARPPMCAIVAYDPCVIDDFEWDDVRIDDYDCSAPQLQRWTTAQALVDVLSELATPP